MILKLWSSSARKYGLNKVTKVYVLFTIIIQRVTASDVSMSKLAKPADATYGLLMQPNYLDI